MPIMSTNEIEDSTVLIAIVVRMIIFNIIIIIIIFCYTSGRVLQINGL